MQVLYVSGPPQVSIGDAGNVLVHVQVSEDEQVTVSHRTPTAFTEWLAELERAYDAAKARRTEPRLPLTLVPEAG